MPKAEKDPRVLAYEKPVRFGRSRLQRHMSYEIMRPMETTTRTQGSFKSLVKFTPCNVMSSTNVVLF